jgi:hypothetical protein
MYLVVGAPPQRAYADYAVPHEIVVCTEEHENSLARKICKGFDRPA